MEVGAALRFALLKNGTELTDRGADGLCGARRIRRSASRAQRARPGRGLVESVQSLRGAVEASHHVQAAVLEARRALLLQQDPVGGGLFLLERTARKVLNVELERARRKKESDLLTCRVRCSKILLVSWSLEKPMASPPGFPSNRLTLSDTVAPSLRRAL